MGLTGLYIYSKSPVPSPLFTGGTIFLATLFMWLLGQLQSRLLFFAVGTVLMVSAGSKLATALLGHNTASSEAAFYWAFWMSFVLPVGLILIFAVMSEMKSETTPVTLSFSEIKKRLLATTALATAATLIPQVDILVAQQLLSPELLGEFSRVSLFYKAGYFGLAIVAQWLLPHQIQQNVSNHKSANWILVLFGLGILGAATAGAVGPALAEYLLKFSLAESRTWIFLSCLNMSAMIALYFFIQTDCSNLYLRRPFILLSLVSGANLVWLYTSPSMTQFLVCICATNITLVAGVYWQHFIQAKSG